MADCHNESGWSQSHPEWQLQEPNPGNFARCKGMDAVFSHFSGQYTVTPCVHIHSRGYAFVSCPGMYVVMSVLKNSNIHTATKINDLCAQCFCHDRFHDW